MYMDHLRYIEGINKLVIDNLRSLMLLRASFKPKHKPGEFRTPLRDLRHLNKYHDYMFDDWRDKVKKRLPLLVIHFFQQGKSCDYKTMMQLGEVIEKIYNPSYSYTTHDFNEKTQERIYLYTITCELFQEKSINKKIS